MDWVVSKIRQWLGLEAELVAMQARLKEVEYRLAHAQNKLEEERKNNVARYVQFSQNIENARLVNEACIGNLDLQISQLRSAFTAANEQRPRATVTAKNWVHAKLLMGEEIDA